MQRRDDSEDESRAKKDRAGDPYPAQWANLKQQNEKYRTDLREGVGLAENAGTEVAQSGNGEQDRAGGKNGNVAAEDHDGELPGNLVQDRQHEEHRAQQKLVGDGIKVLTEKSLLMQRAGQQAIQAVAESGDHENDQRPEITALHQMNHDERNENHPQQRELIGSGEDVGELHARSSEACGAELWVPSPAGC